MMTSHAVETGRRSPSTGTRGSGRTTMMRTATSRPDTMVPTSIVPHRSTQAKASHRVMKTREPNTRASIFTFLDMSAHPRHVADIAAGRLVGGHRVDVLAALQQALGGAVGHGEKRAGEHRHEDRDQDECPGGG